MRGPRYPIYVPTMGRWSRPLTIRFFEKDGVAYRAIVRPDEVEAYRPVVRTGEMIVLPSDVSNLMETRNWIRRHAEAEGHARHWQFDDNIEYIRRLYHGKRIVTNAGPALAAIEDFTDRYENVGISGLNYQLFGIPGSPPYRTNCHVYSATLINHAMPCWWRLIYNDDTDLCLQALTSGWATVLVNVFLADKKTTMKIGGGNTDTLYQGDGRLRMARALEREWPGIAKIVRRYGRETHFVDWPRFRDNPPLRRRADVDLSAFAEPDEYGLRLAEVKPVRNPRLRRVMRTYEREVGGITRGHESLATAISDLGTATPAAGSECGRVLGAEGATDAA